MPEYVTIAENVSAEFVERRSRFIGTISPVSSEKEAMAFIAVCRERYKDATHNVYAYLLRGGQVKRYSDDGEPQGTAGVPILEVLQKEGLEDIAIVVTRYFGGVLLGAGGLIRAYSHGAKITAQMAKRKIMSECTEYELMLGYDFYGKITYFIPQFEAVTTFSDFGSMVCLHVLIKDCYASDFCKGLAELSAARVIPRVIDKRYECISGSVNN